MAWVSVDVVTEGAKWGSRGVSKSILNILHVERFKDDSYNNNCNLLSIHIK